jgi:hypothetical protein
MVAAERLREAMKENGLSAERLKTLAMTREEDEGIVAARNLAGSSVAKINRLIGQGEPWLVKAFVELNLFTQAEAESLLEEKELSAARDDKQPSAPVFHVDPNFGRFLFGSFPDDWLGRLKYVGPAGYNNFVKVMESYGMPSDYVAEVADGIIQVLEDKAFAQYVALGPGDGKIDAQAYSGLTSRSNPKDFLAVDINERILFKCYEKMSSSVPGRFQCVLSDFEGSLRTIVEIARSTSKGRSVFALNGNTFGNLDCREKAFLNSANAHLNKGDLLLIHLSTFHTEHGYSFENDRYRKRNLTDAFKAFICHAVALRFGKSAPYLVKRFENSFNELEVERDLPCDTAKAISIKWNGAQDPVFIITRYEPEATVQWFQDWGNRHTLKLVNHFHSNRHDLPNGHLFILMEQTE